MIAFVISALTAIIVLVVCVAVLVDEVERAIRCNERDARRVSQRLMVPVREHAEAKGIDIETLCILCGAEGWSDAKPQDR